MKDHRAITILFLEDHKIKRYYSLVNRFIDLTDEEFEELNKLREEHTRYNEKRQHVIEEINDKVRQYKISPDDLFDAATIKQSLNISSSGGQGAAKKQGRTRVKWRKSDSAPVLMELKPESGRGRAFTYRQGRIYEGVSPDKPEPAYAVLPARLQEFGFSKESILDKLATPEGKHYFSTQEGNAELNKIVEVVNSFKDR